MIGSGSVKLCARFATIRSILLSAQLEMCWLCVGSVLSVIVLCDSEVLHTLPPRLINADSRTAELDRTQRNTASEPKFKDHLWTNSAHRHLTFNKDGVVFAVKRNTSNISGISRRFRSRGPLKNLISHKTESRRHVQRSATAGHRISVSSILINPSSSSSVLPGRVERREPQIFRSLQHFHIVSITSPPTLQSFAIVSRKHKNINKLQLVSSDGATNHRPLASFMLHRDPAQEKPSKSVLKQSSADLYHHWITRPTRLRLLRPATNIVFPSDNRIPSRPASGADRALAGLSTATLRSGQIHRIHIPHAITGTTTTINPESENVNETLSTSSTIIPLDVIGFRKSSIHKVLAESLNARPMTTSAKKTTTMTTTVPTITTIAPSSTIASSVLPSFSNNQPLIIINRSFAPRNGNSNDSLNHLHSQSSANLQQTSIITTDIPEKDSQPRKLFFTTTHRQVNVTPKFADTSTSEIISRASTTLPIANTDLKFPIQSSLDSHATGERETPTVESTSEILSRRATSESFTKLLGKDSETLLGTLEVPNKVDKSIRMEMPIPLREKEFIIKQVFGRGTNDNSLRESFPEKPTEVFSTMTTLALTSSTSSTTISSTTSSPTATTLIESTTPTTALSPTSSTTATTVTIGSNSTTSLTITTRNLFTKSSTPSSVAPFEPKLPPENLKIASKLEDLDENLVNGVLSTLTPPPSTLTTSLSSVQQIGAPGAAPPNDSVVDELNRAENFMEVAQRLSLFRDRFTQK